MKTSSFVSAGVVLLAAIVLSGCASSRNQVGITNQNQPGPIAGRALGAGIGAVAGNVGGAVVGVGEGVTAGASSAFSNTQRTVRYWHEEKTPDGRTILVSEEYLVDADGRTLRKIK